jgi:hypothetical protein
MFCGSSVQWMKNFLFLGGLGWTIASSLSIYPHCGSYFNELAGGATRGHEHFVSSEMDWGQDLLFLRAWLDEHREAQPLHLIYEGRVEAKLAGIDYLPMPRDHSSPGWYALSVTCLHGGCSSESQRGEYAYFLRLRPTAMAGYSIYIFHVTD